MVRIVAGGAQPARDAERGGTPLEDLDELLSLRLRNLLLRAGFRTAEEVAAASTRGLQDLRGMGTSSLQAIRAAVAEHQADSLRTWDQVTLDQAHTRELVRLLSILAALTAGGEHDEVEQRALALLNVITR